MDLKVSQEGVTAAPGLVDLTVVSEVVLEVQLEQISLSNFLEDSQVVVVDFQVVHAREDLEALVRMLK
jgi:hypothetical protein